MHGVGAKDGDLGADWGRTSGDYGRYRPGYPASFFARIEAWGIPAPGSRVVDLGTGTGNLARALAQRGARVLGIDLALGQIAEARRLARVGGLDGGAEAGAKAEFEVAPAEAIPRGPASFELATASQCWLYFDKSRVMAELRRVLVPEGRLLTCHISWLPLDDFIAGETERLVLAHNPLWSAGGYDGRVPDYPDGSRGTFELETSFFYDEALPFTRESWRGRVRACRGIGATLPDDRVAAFDAELEALLSRIAPESFAVLHRIDAHLLRLR